jgi:hypothetical protein
MEYTYERNALGSVECIGIPSGAKAPPILQG